MESTLVKAHSLSRKVKRKEVIHWPFPFPDRIGRPKRLCDICLGGGHRLLGARPEMSSHSNERGKSAAGSVSRVGDDLFARQPGLSPGGSKQEVIRPAEITPGDHHVQLSLPSPRYLLKPGRCRRQLFPAKALESPPARTANS